MGNEGRRILIFDGRRSRIVLIGPDNYICEYSLRFAFPGKNNMAEYEALVLGMRLAIQLQARRLMVLSDSQLVVGKVAQGLEVKDTILQKYAVLVQNLRGKFEHFEVRKVSRNDNTQADALSKLASSVEEPVGRSKFIEVLARSRFEQEETL